MHSNVITKMFDPKHASIVQSSAVELSPEDHSEDFLHGML